MIDVGKLPRKRLQEMAAAGERILECYRVLRKSEANVVGEVLRGQGEFYEWDHYPEGDVYDFETHSQYYYHTHPPEDRTKKWGAEHGHFHTFLRPKGMPRGVAPAKVADYELPKDANDALSHFIGIPMNQAGFPIRLFTTNRWVTGEIWYEATDVIKMLDRFEMDVALPSWPVNIWIGALLRLFRPQIEKLLHDRDRAVHDWQAAHPGENVFEDRGLEITSIMDISVEGQIKKVKKALKAKNT
jgi:hypothetical protein